MVASLTSFQAVDTGKISSVLCIAHKLLWAICTSLHHLVSCCKHCNSRLFSALFLLTSLCWYGQGAKARLAKAEQALELLLDAQLGAGHLGTGQGCSDDEACSNDSWPAGIQDDYIDSDAEAAADSDDDSTPSTEDRALNTMNSMSRKATANPEPVNSKSNSAKANKKMKMSEKITQQKAPGLHSSANEVPGGKWREVVDDSHPDSFSQIDLSRPQQEIEAQFPLFPVRPFPDITCCNNLFDP